MATDKVNFADVGIIAQALKYQIRCGVRWEDLSPPAKESLDQIATWIARIVSGGDQQQQHWDSIVSFAQAAKPADDPPVVPGRQAIKDWQAGTPEKTDALERGIRHLVRDIPNRNGDA